jgi:hypothetical protein
MQGAAWRAFLSISRTLFADSPTPDSSPGPLMEMKFTPVSCAAGLARRVLPPSGGPDSKMPLVRAH